jgi:hypothetical protein
MNEYVQKQYWTELVELKAHVEYLNFYQMRNNTIDRYIKMSLATTSSASIGGWAIWNQIQYVWAIIIAASQLLNVVKDHLPFQARQKKLGSLGGELEGILLYAERMWFDVSEGRRTHKEIHDLTMELKKRKMDSYNKYFLNDPLPKKEKLLLKAKTESEIYFSNFYTNK